MAEPAIERREYVAQPALFVRARASREQLGDAIGRCLGRVLAHVQSAGLTPGGPPFTRYPSGGRDEIVIEAGLPLAAPSAGQGEVEAGYLHGGPVVVALHAGSYETLSQSYAAIERFVDARGLRTAGSPWESYLTDPAQTPNTDDWRTEIYWPVAD